MPSVIHSVGLFGLNAFPVTIESEVVRGHAEFSISGLPDAGIKESRERVHSAVLAAGMGFPSKKVIVHLAPADVRKSGSSFDLAIFVALMHSMRQLPSDLSGCVFIGELGLGGVVHSTRGVLPMTTLAKSLGYKEIYVPMDNVQEAAVIDGPEIYGIRNTNELLAHLRGEHRLSPVPTYYPESAALDHILDFADVRGQLKARKGVEIAAAGGHNILLIGSPGSGKSMIANRLPTILPKMTRTEILETTNVYSVAGKLSPKQPLITERPFRSPHHTISSAGLVGGGSIPAPGEISLAHNGVLFLDELAEFSHATLEILRQPLESREVTISRASGTASYPCNITLAAAMNPCPCGHYGSLVQKCVCDAKTVRRYLSKISGPLLDRFDLFIDVDPVDYASLSAKSSGEPSAVMRERVEAARERQKARFKGTEIHSNASMPDHLLREFCKMDQAAQDLLKAAFERYGLSARAYTRLQKVALSSADLNGRDEITSTDIAVAINFRGFESKFRL